MTKMMHDAEAAVTDLRGLEKACAAMQALVREATTGIKAGETPSFRDVERAVREHAAAIERAALAKTLEAYEPEAEVVEVDGRCFKRMSERTRGVYFSLAGEVSVQRFLYREAEVHNGPTIVPVELRAGIAHGRWTPRAFDAVGHLHQALPSREVKDAVDRLHVLPYSRATLARAGEQVGQDWERVRVEGEDALVASMAVPEAAVALSVSVDRVTVPMEERIEPPPKDPDAPKVEVNYRQAYCGTITLHDAEGEALECIRYGRMPREGHDTIEEALRGDVAALKSRRQELKVVGLADGAAEMQAILDRVLEGQQPEAVNLDIWHGLEKFAAAAASTGHDAAEYVPRWKHQLETDDHAIDRIDVEIRTWLLDYHEDDVPDALYDAFTYIDNNKERMRYASLRAAHLPIGSGAVEATCKTLVAVRMKRAGSRWKEEGGQACLNLRALALSSRWEPAMAFLTAARVHEVIEAHAA